MSQAVGHALYFLCSRQLEHKIAQVRQDIPVSVIVSVVWWQG